MDHRGSGKNDLYKLAASLPKEFEFSDKLNSTARQQATERAWSAISKFFENCKKKIPGNKGYPKFQKDTRSVEYKQSGWKLVDGCKRIHFSDKCGIGDDSWGGRSVGDASRIVASAGIMQIRSWVSMF